MALGDNYDNNKSKKKNVNTYSLVNLSNPQGVDATKLGFTFWGGLLKLYISPKIENSNGEFAKYDHENSGEVYLSHLKSRQLANIIESYIKDPVAFPESLGVNTKNSVIALHKTLQGSAGPCLVIKVFNDSRQLEASYAYEFKTDFHHTLQDFKDMDGTLNKVFDNTIEMISVQRLLMDFANNANGAAAHFAMEYGKFDNQRAQSKLNAIAQKLGIEWAQKGYNGGGQRQRNLFDDNSSSNNNSGGGSGSSRPGRQYSIDDIE